MSDQKEPTPDRPVLNGLVALLGVALGVGAILAVVALLGSRVLGLGGSDGSDAADKGVHETAVIPSPKETVEATGPRVTLNTEDPDAAATSGSGSAAAESESDDEASDPESSETTETPGAGEISLQSAANAVASGERIYFSGVYPGGEGAVLQLQRFQDGAWVKFPATVNVSNGSFSSYLFTGQSGLNRFRVVDSDSGEASNEIRVTVG